MRSTRGFFIRCECHHALSPLPSITVHLQTRTRRRSQYFLQLFWLYRCDLIERCLFLQVLEISMHAVKNKQRRCSFSPQSGDGSGERLLTLVHSRHSLTTHTSPSSFHDNFGTLLSTRHNTVGIKIQKGPG